MHSWESFDWEWTCIIGAVDWGGICSCSNGVMVIVVDGDGEMVGITATDISIYRFPGEV